MIFGGGSGERGGWIFLWKFGSPRSKGQVRKKQILATILFKDLEVIKKLAF